MDFILVATASLGVSALTLYSGFGLGTLLLPVFALFFPVEAAVAATAVVHGANNAFKLAVVGRHADWGLFISFGVPAVCFSFLGAGTLGFVAHMGEIATYSIGAHTATVTPIKLVLGALMLFFALFELLPRLRRIAFPRKYLFLGGMLSGFFGGLSGHQGALRSAFLAKVGISTEAFVGTNAVIGFMVDAARILVYTALFLTAADALAVGAQQLPLILIAILSAFSGVLLGRRYLHKITMKTVQTIVGALLAGIALALASGVL